MKRLGSFAGLLAVLAFGAGTAAATAGSASIHLKAPSSVPVNKRFTVTASGSAPSEGEQFVFVLFTTKSSCAKSLGAGEQRGDHPLPFNGKDGAQVPHGAYHVTSGKVYNSQADSGFLCGYLYKGTQKADSRPEAHASHAIKFT